LIGNQISSIVPASIFVLGVKIISLYQYSEKSNAIIMNKAEFKDEGVSSIHITKNPRDRNKKYMIDATNLSSVTLLFYYYCCFPSAAGLPAALPLELVPAAPHQQPPAAKIHIRLKEASASSSPSWAAATAPMRPPEGVDHSQPA
jgi:hypothetical protein